MAIGADLEKKLGKIHAPSTTMEWRYKGNDLTVVTNGNGEAVTLFIGKRNEKGAIKGERYARRIVKDDTGAIVKSHWDNKGKV